MRTHPYVHTAAPGRWRLRPTSVIPVVLMTLVALGVLLPAPALAHPFIRGGDRVPVQSLATIELDLAHGCGEEGAGAGARTDEVALEAPDWLWIAEVPEVDGWDVGIEGPDADGTIVVVWSATTGAVPAPRFLLSVVVDGSAGETRHLRVSQRCGDRVERWVGTPEEPAEQPAVRLGLAAPDPSAPPPERPAPTSPPTLAPPAAAADPSPGAAPVIEPTVEPSAGAATARSSEADAGRSPARTWFLVLTVVALGATTAGTVSRSIRKRRPTSSGRTG
jgi:hypothetical protein